MEREKAVRQEPRWKQMYDTGAETDTAASPEGRDRQLVLVVEDDPNDWEIYGKILWYNGFDVLCAADGVTALKLAREYLPDLILLDLGLPGMSGLELCRELKQGPTASDVPVIVLSAQPEAEYGEEARRGGCTRYLEKPQSPVDVLHAVEDVIGPPPPGADGQPPIMNTD
jgi:putative two-component system response regulator